MGLFVLSPSSYHIAISLLLQIASDDGSFPNTDNSCVILAPKIQDIAMQKGWGMREDSNTSAEVVMALLA